MKLVIVKLGYSLDPWRICTDDGRELEAPTFVKTREWCGIVQMPMSYPTKTAAIEGLGDLAGRLLERHLGPPSPAPEVSADTG